MPASSGSARPPDPSEVVSRATRGSRAAPGAPSMSGGDPSSTFGRYASAADPQWEQWRDRAGTGASPTNVMGMIDLAGGDAAAADLLGIGPYEVIPTYEGGSIDYGTTSTGEYFQDESSRFLEDEGFYDERGYGYTHDASLGGAAPSTALISSVGTAPADITQSPTSTTNPDRPRTVAAGYDGSRKVLTVIFRDGTFYNYYGVSGLEWNNFKRSRSKGRFIRTYLNAKTRGVASMGMVPLAHRELLYKVSRTSQVMRGGYTGKQKVGSKRGGTGRFAYGASGTPTSGGRSFRKSKAT